MRSHAMRSERSTSALTRLGWLSAVAFIAVACPTVAGQNALGTGNALDRNLDPRYGGVNPGAPVDRFRQRNLLITNNVVGGRGFRGVVGYQAPGAFSDELAGLTGGVVNSLGSEDTFAFRADSALSNVNYVNYGNTFEQLRFGQDLAVSEYLFAGMETKARVAGVPAVSGSALIAKQLRLDRLSDESTSFGLRASSVEPKPVGGFVDEDGKTFFVHTDSLRGLGHTPAGQMTQVLGLSSFDKARLVDDMVSGRTADMTNLGVPFESSYTNLNPQSLQLGGLATPVDDEVVIPTQGVNPLTVEGVAPLTPLGTEPLTPQGGDPVDNRVDARMDTAVRPTTKVAERVDNTVRSLEEIQGEVAARFAERYPEDLEAPTAEEAEAASLRELEEDMARLRTYLAQGEVTEESVLQPQGPDELNDGSRPTLDQQVPQNRDSLDDFRDPIGSPDEDEPEDELPPGQLPPDMRLEDFGVILRHGKRVESLASGDQTRFDELVTMAEESLRTGDYFWAERRFTRALRFVPGHPLATAGLAHAQLGAGLDLSASLTLRSLFTYQPEMIDVDFASELVPNRPRLLSSLDRIEKRLEVERHRALRGFLYAYVGRLVDDREVIERGLATMESAAPDDPLLPLLKTIWLAPPTK